MANRDAAREENREMGQVLRPMQQLQLADDGDSNVMGWTPQLRSNINRFLNGENTPDSPASPEADDGIRTPSAPPPSPHMVPAEEATGTIRYELLVGHTYWVRHEIRIGHNVFYQDVPSRAMTEEITARGWIITNEQGPGCFQVVTPTTRVRHPLAPTHSQQMASLNEMLRDLGEEEPTPTIEDFVKAAEEGISSDEEAEMADMEDEPIFEFLEA